MTKSEERAKEYYVIIQPRYREHPPYCYRGYAKDEEDAISAVFNSEWHKEVLDVKSSCDITWNSDTVKKYWEMYGEPKDSVETRIRLF